MTNWFKKALTRTPRETETFSERDSLLSHRRRQDINSSTDTVSEAQSQQTIGQEEGKPNLWTGEGMRSRKLEVEIKGFWQKIKGMDTRSAYVNRLTEDFDRRHQALTTWVHKETWSKGDDDLLKQVLDCDRKQFMEDLRHLLDLKNSSSRNALKSSIGEEAKDRAVEFLKAVSDVLEDMDWRLRHVSLLENKGRLSRKELEEAFDAIDTNNAKAYFVVRKEIRQSIRAIESLYEESKNTYIPGKREIAIKNLKKEHKECTNKFMLYFSGRTKEDEPYQKVSAEDIEKWREAGRGLVGAERLIREHGVKKFSSYGQDNQRNGLEDATEE